MDGSPEEGTKLKSVDENGYEKLTCLESCFDRRRLYFLQPTKPQRFQFTTRNPLEICTVLYYMMFYVALSPRVIYSCCNN